MFKFLVADGLKEVIEAFKGGFNIVFNVDNLRCFNGFEMENYVCGGGNGESSKEYWEVESLEQNVIPQHGYSKNSMIYKGLLKIMSELSNSDRKKFLLFVTGAPRLPIGGFKNLNTYQLNYITI